MNKYYSFKNVFLSCITFGILFCWLCALPIKAANKASLTFLPDSISLKKDSVGSVDIYLDSGGSSVVGVDLVINFDPNQIELINITDYGTISYKTKEIIDNNFGKLKLAYSNDFRKYFSGGSTRLLTINFKNKSEYLETFFYFTYESGMTNDTNVVNRDGIDVLETINSLSLIDSNSVSNSTNNEKSEPTKDEDKILALNQNERVLKSNEENFIFPNNIFEKVNPEVLGETVDQAIIPPKKVNYISLFIFLVISLLISCFAFLLGRISKKEKAKLALN